MSGIRRQDGSAFTVELVRRFRVDRARLWPAVIGLAEGPSAELSGAETLVSREPECLAVAWSAGHPVLPSPAAGVERAVVTVTALPLGRRTRVVLVVGGLTEEPATSLAARCEAALVAAAERSSGR